MRIAPPRTNEQQKDHERLQALRSGDPDVVRAWATRWNVPLIDPEDTPLLLRVIHQTRFLDPAISFRLKRESRQWLARHSHDQLSAS